MKDQLRYYFARFLRRLPYFLVVLFAVSGLGITTAYLLPAVYRAEAQLLVEAPQIPDTMAPTTVRTGAPEVLQIIEQRMTTRAKLLDLAQRFKIYDGLANPDPDKIVRDMRARTKIVLPGATDVAAFVTVSFDAPNAELSALVTNDLVTAILQESVALRTASSGQTLDFFKSEVAQLGDDLAQQGSRILQFKLANKDALPDSLDYRRTRQTSQQEHLRDVERQIAGLQDRRSRLVDIYDKTGSVTPTQPATPNDQARLQQLQADLAEAKSIFAADSPKIRILEAQIATIKRSNFANPGTSDPTKDTLNAYQLQLADIDGQIAFLADEKKQTEGELATLQTSIDKTPGNAIDLDALQRDYDNTQLQYNTAVARLSEAATGDRIETLSKGQRITVIEQAVVPQAPAKPPRKLIAAGSVLAGIVLGLGLVFLIEKLNQSIQRPADLINGIGITPLATIPYFRTRRELWRKRLIVTAALCFVVGATTFGLYFIDSHVMPMNLLLQKALEKAGLAALDLPVLRVFV